MLCQGGALFSTLTVAENTQVPLREFFPKLDQALLDESAAFKVVMSGLPADAGPKYPAELSGGMTKRVALARAMANGVRLGGWKHDSDPAPLPKHTFSSTALENFCLPPARWR